jgi:NACalpha-BTF3-like transcription factor
MPKLNPIKQVEQVARALVKEFNYSSMADFTAEDIELIVARTQVEFSMVINILEPELI